MKVSPLTCPRMGPRGGPGAAWPDLMMARIRLAVSIFFTALAAFEILDILVLLFLGRKLLAVVLLSVLPLPVKRVCESVCGANYQVGLKCIKVSSELTSLGTAGTASLCRSGVTHNPLNPFCMYACVCVCVLHT